MEHVRRVKVLSKHVEHSQNDEHVLIIVLELPVTKDGGFRMRRDDFMTEFYEAIKLYEDRMGAGVAWEPKAQDEPDTFAGGE